MTNTETRAKAALSLAKMLDEYLNLGRSIAGLEQLALLIDKRLKRFYPNALKDPDADRYVETPVISDDEKDAWGV